eukprot:gene6918-11081_t
MPSKEKKIKTDFENWLKDESEIIEGISEWCKEFRIQNSEISFKVDLTFTEEFVPLKIKIPISTYPKGKYEMEVRNIKQSFQVDDLISALMSTFQFCEEERDVALGNLVTPTPLDTTPKFDGFESETDFEEVAKVEKEIKEDLELFEKVKEKGWFCSSGAINSSNSWIYIFIDPMKTLDISKTVASAWGLNLKHLITVSLKFSGNYLNSQTLPQIECFQSGFSGIKSLDGSTELQNKTEWGLYWTVQHRVKEFFQNQWPIKERVSKKTQKIYLYDLCLLLENIIKNCSAHCIICGEKLPYAGIKPVVCDKPLCLFSHEQYGLGVNIESEIIKHPDIVDLMVTLCHAACSSQGNSYNPFKPYPEGIEVKSKSKVFNFNRKDEFDNSKVLEVVGKLPSVEQMSKFVKKGIFKEEMNKIHPLAYPLLRWILTSNRCHLKPLTKKEKIIEMNTEHQYLLLSSTPEKEKKFQKLKEKYGSQWGFHGSASCNWHAILRNGLKNMSGTSGQLNGNAYGDGIYLADDCGTSFGYMQYQSPWDKSIFGKNSQQLGIMALCEIIKHPDINGQPNPYFVVANEDIVATRYYFIFSQQEMNSDACASSIKIPKLEDL